MHIYIYIYIYICTYTHIIETSVQSTSPPCNEARRMVYSLVGQLTEPQSARRDQTLELWTLGITKGHPV